MDTRCKVSRGHNVGGMPPLTANESALLLVPDLQGNKYWKKIKFVEKGTPRINKWSFVDSKKNSVIIGNTLQEDILVICGHMWT